MTLYKVLMFLRSYADKYFSSSRSVFVVLIPVCILWCVENMLDNSQWSPTLSPNFFFFSHKNPSFHRLQFSLVFLQSNGLVDPANANTNEVKTDEKFPQSSPGILLITFQHFASFWPNCKMISLPHLSSDCLYILRHLFVHTYIVCMCPQVIWSILCVTLVVFRNEISNIRITQ